MKRTRIRPVSRKRQQRDKPYKAAREQVWRRAGGSCEFVMDDVKCWQPMECVHHIAGRVGPDPHRLSNLLGLCNAHHQFIHSEPEVSRAYGWMRSRHGGQA